MTITRHNLRDKHAEFKSKQIKYVEYYVMDGLANANLFWRHTMWYNIPCNDEKEQYFADKELYEFCKASHSIQCGNVLFHVQSNLPYVETEIAMRSYYEAKTNGNIRTVRLD